MIKIESCPCCGEPTRLVVAEGGVCVKCLKKVAAYKQSNILILIMVMVWWRETAVKRATATWNRKV